MENQVKRGIKIQNSSTKWPMHREVDIKEGGCPGPSNISFMEEGGWKPNINGMTSETLGSDDVRMLGVLFSKEVFVALSSCCGDKALQSDGFVAVL